MNHSDPTNTVSTKSFSTDSEQETSTQLYFENDALWQSPLLPYQRQVQQDILQAIPDDVNSILDAGCGNGVITNILPQEIRVVGLDLSETALSQVQREKKVGSITNLPFEDNSFDLVMANDILEHLTEEDQQLALREIQRVSSRYVLITVPFLEDLNIGSIRCPDCQRFYHVNHHRQSFDLKKVHQLFHTPGLKLPEMSRIKTILSGDRWSNDPPEVVLIKRLLGVDLCWNPHSVCMHCGHALENEENQDETTPRLSQFLSQLTGYLFSQSPQRRSIGFAPTEVICLFEKPSVVQENTLQKVQDEHSADSKNLPFTQGHNKGVYLNQKGQILSTEPLRFTSRYVDFRHPEFYLKNQLPHTGILPYFLSPQASPEGVHISSDHPVLVGFFGKLNDFHRVVELRLKGYAPSKTLLTVECYDDVFAYHSPVQVAVYGGFHLKLQMNEASFSRYGLLFKIYASEKVVLKRAKVLHVEGPRIKAFKENRDKAVALKLPLSQSLYLGLPENEIIEKRIYTHWMEHPHLLRPLPVPNLSEFKIDEERVFLEKLFQQLKHGFENTLQKSRSPSQYYLKRLILACVGAIQSFQPQLEETIETSEYSNPSLLAQLSKNLDQALEKEYALLLSEGRYCSIEGQKEAQKSSQGLEKKKSIGARLRSYFKFLNHPPAPQLLFPQKTKKSFQDFKNSLLSNAVPEAFDYQFLREQSLSTVENVIKKQFLMICHDQEMDRRIIQQAQALIDAGWCGRVICLSYDDEDEIELYEGITLHRIGKKRLIPEPCPAYWRYQKRTFKINSLGKGFRLLHKWNWKLYKQDLKRTYQCQSIQYPLPFDLPFYQAGRLYPSELIIAHDLTALKSAHHLAQEWHVPLIYDSHEFYSEQIVFSNYQKQLMDTVEKEYSPDCAAIITVSQSIAQGMAEKNNIPVPHVILNVTDPPEGISPLRTHLIHETLHIPLDHKIVLFQGGMVPRRNLTLLVEGFRHLNPTGAHLVMLGPSHPKYLNKLQNKAGALLNHTIHFLPPVPQQQLLHFTTSADCGVIPYPPVDLNTKYCLPNKTFEYIQACLPILSNDLVELALLFERIEGGGLVTDLNSIQTMRDALQKMLHRDLNRDRERLAQIKESFTWKKEKGRYLQIVEQAMVTVQR